MHNKVLNNYESTYKDSIYIYSYLNTLPKLCTKEKTNNKMRKMRKIEVDIFVADGLNIISKTMYVTCIHVTLQSQNIIIQI